MDNRPTLDDDARKKAQEQYVEEFAAKKGMTVDQLENRLLSDLAAGVPDRETMTILTNMFHAAERITSRQKEQQP